MNRSKIFKKRNRRPKIKIMDLMNFKKCCKNTEQQILIVAGPGSGKTTVLTQHIDI